MTNKGAESVSVNTHNCVLGVGLLVLHLQKLFWSGTVDAAQHVEPATATETCRQEALDHVRY